MSETGIDYSKYPYKILERKWVDWDGLFFALDFTKPLEDNQKIEIENIYHDWGIKNQEGDKSIHFFSDCTWNKIKSSLEFWADMGSAESSILEELLDSFSKQSEIIKELFVGRNPKSQEPTP